MANIPAQRFVGGSETPNDQPSELCPCVFLLAPSPGQPQRKNPQMSKLNQPANTVGFCFFTISLDSQSYRSSTYKPWKVQESLNKQGEGGPGPRGLRLPWQASLPQHSAVGGEEGRECRDPPPPSAACPLGGCPGKLRARPLGRGGGRPVAAGVVAMSQRVWNRCWLLCGHLCEDRGSDRPFPFPLIWKPAAGLGP